MAITRLLSPLQRTASTRATSFASALTPPVKSAVRGSSWLAEYLKKQAEKEAEQKAAEEQAAAEQAAAEQAAAEQAAAEQAAAEQAAAEQAAAEQAAAEQAAAEQAAAEQAAAEQAAAEQAAAEQAAAEQAAAEQAAAEQAAAEQAAAEQVSAEQAALEAQKQAYKDDADFIYENDGNTYDNVDLTGTINPSTGQSPNWFLDVGKGKYTTGEGDDVAYMDGYGVLSTRGGDDIVYVENTSDELWISAYLGEGNDMAFGGKGHQEIRGFHGNDYIDSGDDTDLVNGGGGADEFIIDLQNSGVDTILDFVHVGDKITVLDGGESSQGDWYLNFSDSFNGLVGYANNAVPQQFCEIWSSDNELKAVFGVGVDNTAYIDDLANFHNTTAKMSSDGIQILTTEFVSPEEGGSLEFV
ncbi:Hemolysin-type calcium-binding region:RTX N-terminal domain [Prochlorococcus marinus str. MIT 9313]|uniref:Hemolysin-type calcium-binding region:RTX N-terminal domain n=1 Tax=Prochlorococcus marinus (strain MIT 9313) TaxID=74547 RepID=Q7V733_PROMM|nr:calcium-binding protein [Prochlorococcus marinus]CAE21104.1 Hemolysin-type calcium-binding region:RTX N-terminal domain [Prochlorococcus marinus str. MIT 9313]